MDIRPIACAICGKPLPTPQRTGRARRYCSDKCRHYAKRRREAGRTIGWRPTTRAFAKPTDPLTLRRRTLETVVRLLDGDTTPRIPEDQVAQALIEIRQLAWTLRRAGHECPPQLRARSDLLAADIERALATHFAEVA